MEKRVNGFINYMQQGAGAYFMGGNLAKIMENLERADATNHLREFILDEKPYRCAFPYLGETGARAKDQIAIVITLNIYGLQHPGFAERLNRTLKSLARGNTYQVNCVLVLLAAQMELQAADISLINFVDRELVELVNSSTRRKKAGKIVFWSLCAMASAIGMPGFVMLGASTFPPIVVLGLGCGVFCMYSLIRIVFWACLPIFKKAAIDQSDRPIGDCVVEPEEPSVAAAMEACAEEPTKEGTQEPAQVPAAKPAPAEEIIYCTACGAKMKRSDNFCQKCGKPRYSKI